MQGKNVAPLISDHTNLFIKGDSGAPIVTFREHKESKIPAHLALGRAYAFGVLWGGFKTECEAQTVPATKHPVTGLFLPMAATRIDANLQWITDTMYDSPDECFIRLPPTQPSVRNRASLITQNCIRRVAGFLPKRNQTG